MDACVEKAQNAFVDRMGQLGAEMGLSSAVGAIYAFLFMSDGARSLDEICEATGMSKGNASVNMRDMERWGAVRKVPVRGDRRSYYEANLDIVGVIRGQLREGLERRMNDAERALAGIESALEAVSATGEGGVASEAGTAGKGGSGALSASEGNGDVAMKVMRERLANVRETGDSVKALIKTFL